MSVVQRTYWTAGTGTNLTNPLVPIPYTLYVGLSSLLYVRDCSYYDVDPNCNLHSIPWSSAECSSEPTFKVACDSCAAATNSLWFLAFSSCASMMFSVLGAQARIRGKCSDTPVQKMLGMFTELNGAVSLAMGLNVFNKHCYMPLRDTFRNNNMTTDWANGELGVGSADLWLGPGFYCYCGCCASGLLRCLLHWLTPLPEQGKGFFFPFMDLFSALHSACCCGGGVACAAVAEGGAKADKKKDGADKVEAGEGEVPTEETGRATPPSAPIPPPPLKAKEIKALDAAKKLAEKATKESKAEVKKKHKAAALRQEEVREAKENETL